MGSRDDVDIELSVTIFLCVQLIYCYSVNPSPNRGNATTTAL